MKQTKAMTLNELCSSAYPEEVKAFILAYSIQTQAERLAYYGMSKQNQVGVILQDYSSVLRILEQGDKEIRTVIEIYGILKISYVIEVKTKGKKGRGMMCIVNSKQLKYLQKNYGIKNKIEIHPGHINHMLLQNFYKINKLL